MDWHTNEDGELAKAEAMLLQGDNHGAAKEFREVVANRPANRRLIDLFEKIAKVCEEMPTHDSSSATVWTEWRSQVEELSTYLTKSDVKLTRILKIMQGDVKEIVKYFQDPDGAARWRGQSWPIMLSAILLFQAPTAQRHVLGMLADRCVEPLQAQHEFEATRIAFHGEAMSAIQKIRTIDAWCACHMAEIFSRSGALEAPSLYDPKLTTFNLKSTDLDIRQTMIVRFILQTALGPGRVANRPVDGDAASLQTAFRYLQYADLKLPSILIANLILDRVYLCSQRFAVRVFHLARAFPHMQLSIAKRMIEKYLKEGSVHHAVAWAQLSRNQQVEKMLLARILESTSDSLNQLQQQAQGVQMDVQPDEVWQPGPNATSMLSEHLQATLRVSSVSRHLIQAKQLYQARNPAWTVHRDQAAEEAANALYRIPIEHRLQLLNHCLLFEKSLMVATPGVSPTVPKLSSKACIGMLHALNDFQDHSLTPELTSVLLLAMTSQV